MSVLNKFKAMFKKDAEAKATAAAAAPGPSGTFSPSSSGSFNAGPHIWAMSAETKAALAKGVKYNIKIAIRGQRNTGKTSLMLRLNGRPLESQYVPTPEIAASTIYYPAGGTSDTTEGAKVELWDIVDEGCAGQSSPAPQGAARPPSKKPSGLASEAPPHQGPALFADATTVDVYRGCQAVIFMVDASRRETFDYVRRHVPDVPPTIAVMICINFCDRPGRVVTDQEVDEFCRGLSGAATRLVLDCITTTRDQQQQASPPKEYAASASWMPCSMRTGLGVDAVKAFFDIPFALVQLETLEIQMRGLYKGVDAVRADMLQRRAEARFELRQQEIAANAPPPPPPPAAAPKAVAPLPVVAPKAAVAPTPGKAVQPPPPAAPAAAKKAPVVATAPAASTGSKVPPPPAKPVKEGDLNSFFDDDDGEDEVESDEPESESEEDEPAPKPRTSATAHAAAAASRSPSARPGSTSPAMNAAPPAPPTGLTQSSSGKRSPSPLAVNKDDESPVGSPLPHEPRTATGDAARSPLGDDQPPATTTAERRSPSPPIPAPIPEPPKQISNEVNLVDTSSLGAAKVDENFFGADDDDDDEEDREAGRSPQASTPQAAPAATPKDDPPAMPNRGGGQQQTGSSRLAGGRGANPAPVNTAPATAAPAVTVDLAALMAQMQSALQAPAGPADDSAAADTEDHEVEAAVKPKKEKKDKSDKSDKKEKKEKKEKKSKKEAFHEDAADDDDLVVMADDS